MKIDVGDLATYSPMYADYLFNLGLPPEEIKRTVYLVVRMFGRPGEGLSIETLDRNGVLTTFYEKDLRVLDEK